MFTEQDIADLDAFGKLVADKATFELNVASAIQLVKHLNSINSLRKKISDNILEYRRLMQAPVDESMPKSSKKAK